MSKILLVDPPWYIFQRIKSDSVSLGNVYLATVLKDSGHDCLIYNGDFITDSLTGQEGVLVDYRNYINELTHKTARVWADFMNVLNEFKPDYVGISMLTAKYGSAVELGKIVKTYDSEIPVLVGGVHPTLQPTETLKEPYFDIVVVGEGEKTVIELIKTLESNTPLSSVRGIYYKENDTILHNSPRPLINDIDAIPFPDFSLLYRFEEHAPDYLNSILTSRGCPFKCTFCASNNLWGRKVRFRTPENVFAEIKYRYDNFGVRKFRFNDDTFTLSRQRLEKLCELIIKFNEGMGIKWMCDTRADQLNEDTLKIMKTAGCSDINIGVESGSAKILDLIQKGETLETIKSAFLLAKRMEIKTHAYFMMGFPYETKEDVLRSIQFMREIRPDVVCWSLLTPYPGTEIYNRLIEEGSIIPPQDWSCFFHHSPEMNFSSDISTSEWLELIKLVETAICDYYRDIEIEKNMKTPIQSILKRLISYRKKPSLILRDFSLVPEIYRSVSRRFK